jgi:hypothetical protein
MSQGAAQVAKKEEAPKQEATAPTAKPAQPAPPAQAAQPSQPAKPASAPKSSPPVQAAKPVPKAKKVSLEDLLSSMKGLQDDVGQISELRSEEKRVVDVFFESFLQLMRPLAKTMSVSLGALPAEFGGVVQANVDPKGNLILLYPEGQVEIRNLNDVGERDLMVCVMHDVMPKFKQLTSAHRREIESRMKFLSSVTQEIQKVSKAFAAADADD